MYRVSRQDVQTLDTLYQALHHLGYRSIALSESDDGWIRMETTVGTFALWKIEDTTHFLKTYQLLQRFSVPSRHLMPYVPFANGQLILKVHGNMYVLSLYPQGENASSLLMRGDMHWLRSLLRVLAMVHRERAFTLPAPELKESLRHLSKRWKEDEQTLKEWIKSAQNALYPSPLEAILVANADDLLQGMATARAAIELYLQEDALPVSYEIVFAHGALSLKNIYLARQGIVLVDWRKATMDAPARDLSRILREVIQSAVPLGITVEIEGWLKTYELVRPLSVLDRQLLYVALHYPHEPLAFLKRWKLQANAGDMLEATHAFEAALDQYVLVHKMLLNDAS